MTNLLTKQHIKVLWLLLFIIANPIRLFAQLNFDVQKIDMPKPFHRAYIQQLMQDDQGLVYFTTNQGIWRYDGTDVQPFYIPNANLPEGNLIADFYCYSHYLFFCYRKDADLIYCYDKIKQKLSEYRVPKRFKYAIDQKNHQLFLYNLYGDCYLFNENSGFKKVVELKKYRNWNEKNAPEVYLFDAQGKPFLVTENNLATLNGKVIHRGKGDSLLVNGKYEDRSPFNREGTYVTDAYSTSKYVVAIYLSGFAIYDKNTLDKLYEYHNGSEKLNSFVCTFPQGDSIIVICKSVPGGKALPISKNIAKQYTDVYPYSGLQRTWNGTTKGSLFAASVDHLYFLKPTVSQNADTSLTNFITKQIRNKSTRAIYSDQGRYYIGTYADMFVFSDRKIKRFPFLTYTIKPAGKGELMLGIEGGDGFYTLNTKTDKIDTLPNTVHDYLGVTKLLPYKDGFIAGMRNRLYTVKRNATGKWEHQILTNNANVDIVKDIAFIDNQLWVAGEWGVAIQQGKEFRKIPVDGQSILPIYAILPYKNSIFLATSGKGIIEIDRHGKKLRDIKFMDGLAGMFVYSLLEVDGLLFAGTNGGVSVFDMEQGMHPLPYPEDDQFEELYNQEFNHSAMFYDKANRQVVMGGLQGVIFLSVDRYKAMRGNKTDKAILAYVRKEDDAVTPNPINLFAGYEDGITVNPDEKLVALKFAGGFKQKDLLFRIREISDDWRKNKLSEEISLYSLPPGTYTLQIRFPLTTNPHYWFTKSIIVKPSFYQSWVFKVLIILLIVLIVYQIWLMRIKKLRSELELRTSIASDLHDEIGSTLTRISMRSELMYVQQKADEAAIQHISNDSKNAISSISDIIWSVDARNDSKEDLISRMQQHIHNMLDNAGDVKFETYGLEQHGTLPQLVRQNIYLIFKEAVNNVVRHNDKPDVWIKLDNQALGMIITIKNTINPKAGSGFTGQGLKNMKMRAKRINAALVINADEKYFLVTLKTKRW